LTSDLYWRKIAFTQAIATAQDWECNRCLRQQRRCGKLTTVLDHGKSLEENGFAIVSECLSEQVTESLCSQFGSIKHPRRNLLDIPSVRELAASEPVKQLVVAVLGNKCFAVRGILFNKTLTGRPFGTKIAR
jgi:ribosomal protein L20A (L18A)